ncbi:MAG: thioredoxin family protein [Chitinophagaceae bacterium]|nr:MAG: thioredoxin family protein [Chitinophagaceae bacterium]
MNKTLDTIHLQKGMSYECYRKLIGQLLLLGKATGTEQSEKLLDFTRTNVATMQRLDKEIRITPETESLIRSIRRPQTWIVLTEGWCRDAAHIVPVLNAMCNININIELSLVLRDDNPELMDQYLTNGTSRSIPKLIAVNSRMEELFNWGASASVKELKGDEKTIAIQQELSELLEFSTSPQLV